MDQYGNANAARRTDEFGNQTTDAYGKPIGQQGYGHETGGPGVGTGFGAGGAVTHGSGGTAQMMHPERHHQQEKKGGILHRSGSSSSSSSDEDDGMGGRRKKGLKEKIKEKLPGHQKNDEFGQPIQGQGQGHTATGYGGTGTGTGAYHDPEKRGVVDKVKEKLPGHQTQRTDEYGQPIQGQGHTATGYGATGTGTGTTGTGYGGTGTGTGTAGYREPEKKGMMEKIKEKLPGQH